MQNIIRPVRMLSAVMNQIAVLALIFMMFLTCGDIILRLFRHPIPGTYEIVGFLGALIVGFALSHTTIQKGHVAVELLVDRFSEPVQRGFFLVTQCLNLVLFIFITFELFRYAGDMKRAGEVSLTLKIPYFPVLYGIACSTGLVCVVLLIEWVLVATKKKTPWFRWSE